MVISHVLTHERNPRRIQELALGRLRELKIEPPTAERLDRLIRSTVRTCEDEFSQSLFDRLSPETKERLDSLLEPPSPEATRVPLHDLRVDPEPASIATLEEELAKLAHLKAIALPPDLTPVCLPTSNAVSRGICLLW